jgi:hypothetical protein
MTPKEYNIFSKTELFDPGAWAEHAWDVFASAFNSSDRVQIVFDRANAKRKYWLIHSEYAYQEHELPDGVSFRISSDEAQSMMAFVRAVEKDVGRNIDQISFCIDLTGFMRPHLLFLALYLHVRNV